MLLNGPSGIAHRSLAAGLVRDQAIVREEHIDAAVFDGWTGRCRIVPLVDDDLVFTFGAVRSQRMRPAPRSIAIVTSASPR